MGKLYKALEKAEKERIGIQLPQVPRGSQPWSSRSRSMQRQQRR